MWWIYSATFHYRNNIINQAIKQYIGSYIRNIKIDTTEGGSVISTIYAWNQLSDLVK